MPIPPGGDFNASVGSNKLYEDETIIGKHGYGYRNPRGEWICNWAQAEQLIIINTSNSTSHIYNLNKNQGHNKAPVIKSADYDSGGNNFTK